jgi:AraC-like DNA-binding protein
LRSREITRLGDRLVRVRQRVEAKGGEPGADATGPYWVFAIVRVLRGAVRYIRGANLVTPPGPRFAIFMPPWSIVRAAPGRCITFTDAVASPGPVFDGAPPRAIAWRWPRQDGPATVDAIAAAVREAGETVEVSREVEPSSAARRLKRILDDAYCRPVPLSRLAAEAGVSPSIMTRRFKAAYGMPPVEYRHRLRVTDAVFRLAQGDAILSVMQDVGFGDSSRLYRHFQSLVCAPPGTHVVPRSKNAKT